MSIQNNLISRRTYHGSSDLLVPEAQSAVLERASLGERLSDAIRKTHQYYLEDQHPDGYWWYELESNVTIIAEYLMLLHFLRLRDPEKERKISKHILRNQSADGSWPLYRGGRGDLSTTIEAYFVLKLAGYSADREPLRKARAFILQEGGIESARVFTKVYLALFGEYDWRSVPSLPVEMNLFPSWFPLNIYNCSSWARSTVVPLSVVLAFKPVRPGRASIRELYPDLDEPSHGSSGRRFTWKKIFFALDAVVKLFERLPVPVFRKRALKKTEQWIIDHQEPSGDWGGIQPAMVNSILALVSIGYGVDSEHVQKGLQALERFMIERDNELSLQSCISPVWDTALTSLALLSSGMEREHAALVDACAWLASKQILRKGDWSIKKPGLEPGGWAFEFENSWYPDVDDSAIVLLFLTRYAETGNVKPENLARGVNWVLGMQGRDGGWGAFDVNNNVRLLNHLPFGDLEAMTDPSTADLTGRVLELLGTLRFGKSNKQVQRALAFIRKEQEENGSWWGRWGVNYLYGTSTVLTGLRAIGENMASPYIRKAVEWLKRKQNPDGGWGESCGTYEEPDSGECMESTPSQTAWAMLGLIAAGESACPEVFNGVRYLLERQNDNGTWDEEVFTGTGFPKHFFIRYHNYRNCFPLMALGKFVNAVSNERARI